MSEEDFGLDDREALLPSESQDGLITQTNSHNQHQVQCCQIQCWNSQQWTNRLVSFFDNRFVLPFSLFAQCCLSYLILLSSFMIVGMGISWILDLSYSLLLPPTLYVEQSLSFLRVATCVFASIILMLSLSLSVALHIQLLSSIWMSYEGFFLETNTDLPKYWFLLKLSSPILSTMTYLKCHNQNLDKPEKWARMIRSLIGICLLILLIVLSSFDLFIPFLLISLSLLWTWLLGTYAIGFFYWFYCLYRTLRLSSRSVEILHIFGQTRNHRSTVLIFASFITLIQGVIISIDAPSISSIFSCFIFGSILLFYIIGYCFPLTPEEGANNLTSTPISCFLGRRCLLVSQFLIFLYYVGFFLFFLILSFLVLQWPLALVIVFSFLLTSVSLIPSDQSETTETYQRVGSALTLWNSLAGTLVFILFLTFFGIVAGFASRPGHADASKSIVVSSPFPLPPSADPYQICFEDWAGLAVTDLGFFAQLAYKDPVTIQKDLILWFANSTWQLIYNQSTQSPGFLEFYNPSQNTSVISVRGTVMDSSDWLQNAEIWQASVLLQVADLLGPGLRLWPLWVVQTVVKSINQIRLWSTRQPTSYYLRTIQIYIDTLIPRRNQVFITGHSLGGGLANMLGASNRLRSIGFSAPGILYIASSVGIETENIWEWTSNIQPENDLVPKIDAQSNLNQWIECTHSTFGCHDIEVTLFHSFTHPPVLVCTLDRW